MTNREKTIEDKGTKQTNKQMEERKVRNENYVRKEGKEKEL